MIEETTPRSSEFAKMSNIVAKLSGIAVTGLLLAVAPAPPAEAQPASRGKEAYRLACARCHGEQGTGDGVLRRVLAVAPSDLTTLRQRSPDRTFPFLAVLMSVDGRSQVPAHGTRDMPAWGEIFAMEAGDRLGPYGTETYVRGRLVELVEYLETLQR
jgi:mono/diheme cytochrome c family protein